MKKLLFLFICFLMVGRLFGQSQFATTTDGKTVILKANGTWEYIKNNATPIHKLKSDNSRASNKIHARRTSSRKSTGRVYITGPRGGCYYINSNGGKTYVDRSMCN